MIERFSSGAPWEEHVGYSRIVRVGPWMLVAGTTATGANGDVDSELDAYAQTRMALENISTALEQTGASLSDVVQTRMYVTDIRQWGEFGRAHGDVFREIRPVTAMVEVARLIDEAMLIEIEATAYVADEDESSKVFSRTKTE